MPSVNDDIENLLNALDRATRKTIVVKVLWATTHEFEVPGDFDVDADIPADLWEQVVPTGAKMHDWKVQLKDESLATSQCQKCGRAIDQDQNDFSMIKLGVPLCTNCHKYAAIEKNISDRKARSRKR